MKKIEFVYKELLYQVLEKNVRIFTQLELSKELNISLSTVNYALKPLRRMGAIEVRLKNFRLVDPQKILYYWASIRDLGKDIIYKTRINKPIRKVESEMPFGVVFGCYSAYKFRFKDVPADYSEIYVYGDVGEIKKRFPEDLNTPNLFVLAKDESTKHYSKMTSIAQTFVDLWNLREWYAKDFVTALQEKIGKLM